MRDFLMFTDLHCHLLWGIDDGAADEAETLAMARALAASGFGAVAPSPHAQPQFADGAACEARRAEVAALLAREGVALALHPNAENFLDERFLVREQEGRGRHLGAGRWVLVEAPYETVVPAFGELLFRLARKGVRPLFAHPERCANFQDFARAEQAVAGGAALQLDLGSLTGKYGRAARKTAQRLLERGLYAVAATDLHHAKDAEKWVGQAIAELRGAAGDDGVERLLGENPARLLRGEEPLS